MFICIQAVAVASSVLFSNPVAIFPPDKFIYNLTDSGTTLSVQAFNTQALNDQHLQYIASMKLLSEIYFDNVRRQRWRSESFVTHELAPTDIDGSPMPDTMIASLSGMVSLRIEPRSLRHLSELKHLNLLYLSCTTMRPDELCLLRGCRGLSELMIKYPRKLVINSFGIDGSGFRDAHLPALENLALEESSLDEKGMHAICQIKTIRSLNIS